MPIGRSRRTRERRLEALRLDRNVMVIALGVAGALSTAVHVASFDILTRMCAFCGVGLLWSLGACVARKTLGDAVVQRSITIGTMFILCGVAAAACAIIPYVLPAGIGFDATMVPCGALVVFMVMASRRGFYPWASLCVASTIIGAVLSPLGAAIAVVCAATLVVAKLVEDRRINAEPLYQ